MTLNHKLKLALKHYQIIEAKINAGRQCRL